MKDSTSDSTKVETERQFWIAEFSNKTDTRPRQHRVTENELIKAFAKHDIRKPKDGLLFSPTKYKDGGMRQTEDVELLSAVVIDIDGADYEAVKTGLLEFRHWAFTTHSHGSEKGDRWRIVVPLARDVLAADWQGFYPSACAFLVGPNWDTACRDACRMHYAPTCHPDRIALKRVMDVPGRLLDPDEVPIIEMPVPVGEFHDPADSPVRAVLKGELIDGAKHGQLVQFIYWARLEGRSKAEAIACITGAILNTDLGRLEEATHDQCIAKYVTEIDRAWSRFQPLARGQGARADNLQGSWPEPMDEAAFPGIIGDYLDLIEPETQADRAAILLQFLAFVGSAVGRSRHVQVGSDRHYTNIFVLVVGRSSRSGKGTSWGIVKAIARRVAPEWHDSVATGLSSREGLAHHLRDSDESPTAKNVLIVEPEFGSVLRVAKRDGNAITGAIREAWDGDRFQVLTRKDPITSTDVHLSVVAHITQADLQAQWNVCDSSNGFANRFLWVCAQKSKDVPLPKPLDGVAFEGLDRRLREALAFGNTTRSVPFDPGAKEVWTDAYPLLDKEAPGLAGDLTARAAPQVLRLALIYSILDLSDVISKEHLVSAFAVWDYCSASVRYLFGGQTDRLTEAIRNLIATRRVFYRSDIHDAVNRNYPKGAIDQALVKLLADGEIVPLVESDGNGRPREGFCAP